MAEKLIPLEDAQSIVLSHVAPTDLVEISVWQAAGLPLAEDAVADIDISPFANSAMDGYAAVSYTHLDVYKRQSWGSTRCRM